MSTIFVVAAAIAGFALFVHLTSIAVVMARSRRGVRGVRVPIEAPAVSIVRPVCGLEAYSAETLSSGLKLDYPAYETMFCVAQAGDPIVPLINRLTTGFPRAETRLLVGNEALSDNPKLNNMAKGWRAARHDWVIFADSNVLMPPDYIQRLLAHWRPGVGLVCAPPLGVAPEGVWAEWECAFLNTYQARWQLFADSLGHGFAQGKTMLFDRRVLQALGGIDVLAAEPAEDAAATKALRGAGLRVRLADAPVAQPLGRRSAAEVWRRQVRWGRLRRKTFPLFFIPELLTGAAVPVAAAGLAAWAAGGPVAACMLLFAVVWYGTELMLAYSAGWHLSRRSPLMLLLRDLSIPALWVVCWAGDEFEWRGNAMSVADRRGTA